MRHHNTLLSCIASLYVRLRRLPWYNWGQESTDQWPSWQSSRFGKRRPEVREVKREAQVKAPAEKTGKMCDPHSLNVLIQKNLSSRTFNLVLSSGGGVQWQQQVLPASPDEAHVESRAVGWLLKWDLGQSNTQHAQHDSSWSDCRNFALKHRVFLLRNWEKIREKRELLKKEGEREREKDGSLSQYARWGGVIRDDGNIKSGLFVCVQALLTLWLSG